MKNFVQTGASLQTTAPAGGVVSGNGYLIGSRFGVAQVSAAAGAIFEHANEGVFSLPKAAQAMAEGVKLYWDDTAKVVTTTATSNTLIGFQAGVGTVASGTATVDVLLKI